MLQHLLRIGLPPHRTADRMGHTAVGVEVIQPLLPPQMGMAATVEEVLMEVKAEVTILMDLEQPHRGGIDQL
jgi:hypothetical protein